jgi:hypothetical protein
MAELPGPHIPIGGSGNYAGQGGGATSLTELADVTGEPGPGKAPVADHTGETFPLTEVATQAYVDEQVDQALGRWADLEQKMGWVTAIAPPWEASNPTVVLTPDGLLFGPYPDGSAAGGSIRYHGLDGQPFSSVKNLAYHGRWTADAPAPAAGSEFYARVFMLDPDGVTVHDAAFTPGSQPYPGLGAGPFQEWVATAGYWRYDDDSGTGGVPLADLQAQYGQQTITKITITVGFTGGVNLGGLLRWMQINGDRYTFGAA